MPSRSGDSVGPAPLPAQLVASVDGVVIVDAPCRECQYNLRGLKLAGQCPECGAMVELSLRGDRLNQSDPQWLATLRRGLLVLIASWIITVFVVIRAIAFRHGRAQLATSLVLETIVSGLSFTGSWLATTPDPSGRGEAQYGRSRQTVRVMIGIEAVAALLNLSLMAGAVPAAAQSPLHFLQQLLALAGVVAMVAMLLYLSKLAVRIPDRAAQRWAWILAWAQGAVLGYFELLAIVLGFLASGRRRWMRFYPAVLSTLAIDLFALLVVMVIYLILIGWFSRRIRQARDQVRETEASGGAK
jgi:hypothetical protein